MLNFNRFWPNLILFSLDHFHFWYACRWVHIGSIVKIWPWTNFKMATIGDKICSILSVFGQISFCMHNGSLSFWYAHILYVGHFVKIWPWMNYKMAAIWAKICSVVNVFYHWNNILYASDRFHFWHACRWVQWGHFDQIWPWRNFKMATVGAN